ncbi:zinc finger protein 391-like isoform X2 [Euwallacea fornicatus]|uniref:zinc finger protein 391-like isoform X2 n=1 Tax=Euwallacea fornicatus TaxID=995702 RepID=UPI00338DF73D
MEICRLCLTRSTDFSNISQNKLLISRIKQCVSIQITPMDDLPKHVCAPCIEQIQRWYKFKIMCLQSKRTLEIEGFKNCEYLNDAQLDQDVTKNSHTFNKDITNHGPMIDNANGFEPKQIGNIHICNFCSQTFEYYTDYLDHQVSHNGKIAIQCDKCDLAFPSMQSFAQHEKSHKIHDKIPCHICGTVLQRQSMKMHLNKHTGKFQCSECPTSFSGAQLLKSHVSAKHLKLKQYFCDFCGKGFGTKSSLNLHLKIHNEEKSYKCHQCDYSGKTSGALRMHMSKHESGTYVCEYCSKIFKSFKNLRDHLSRVHSEEKKHSCDICSKKFKLRYLLEHHKRTHTGVQPYTCLKCAKTFTRSDGLKVHLQTHIESETTFQCQLCERLFKTKRGVKRHNCPNVINCKN